MPGSLEIFLRSICSFIALLILARIMGKKQISQLTFFDYVVGISIGSVAGSISVDKRLPVWDGVVSLVTWGILPIIVAFLALKAYRFRTLVNGKPAVIIKSGELQEDTMRKERMSATDVLQMLRLKNVFNVADVEFAVLETDGQVSVIKKAEQEPLTPGRLGLIMPEPTLPHLVIMDGKVLSDALQTFGHDEAWLIDELAKQGVAHVHDVFLAQVGSDGQVYLDLYEDNSLPALPKPKPLLLASLKKAEADLELYALQTDRTDVRRVYTSHAKALTHLIHAVTPYLVET